MYARVEQAHYRSVLFFLQATKHAISNKSKIKMGLRWIYFHFSNHYELSRMGEHMILSLYRLNIRSNLIFSYCKHSNGTKVTSQMNDWEHCHSYISIWYSTVFGWVFFLFLFIWMKWSFVRQAHWIQCVMKWKIGEAMQLCVLNHP